MPTDSGIDIGVITGSGVYTLPGASEPRRVETRFGVAEVSVVRVGRWTVGAISRHGRGHHHLPHTVPHRANLLALEGLGARAVLATTVVGAVDPELALGRPVIFDDLYFPENRLPNGEPCTVFTEPGELERGHLVWGEPFSPPLRRALVLAVEGMGAVEGGVYAHTNGPRFETGAEIRALAAAGVSAVSQTCGPEVVLAGELGLPYAIVGLPVNYATGVSPDTGVESDLDPKADLDIRLAGASEALTGLVMRAVGALEEGDLAGPESFVYRVEGGVGRGSPGL